jgi:4'-phosphopantetheinyl transferase
LPKLKKIFSSTVYFGFLDELKEESILRKLNAEDLDYVYHEKNKIDRSIKIISRYFLRKILVLELGLDSDFTFDFSSNGKPFIKDLPYYFNLSHCQECFVIGLSKYKIGVDVETLDRPVEIYKMSEFLFSERELIEFNALNTKLQKEAFTNAWTRKEAFVKANAGNMNFPLSQLEISFAPGQKAILKNTKWSIFEKNNWSIKSIELNKNCKCAVAINTKQSSLEVKPLRQFEEQFNLNQPI